MTLTSRATVACALVKLGGELVAPSGRTVIYGQRICRRCFRVQRGGLRQPRWPPATAAPAALPAPLRPRHQVPRLGVDDAVEAILARPRIFYMENHE